MKNAGLDQTQLWKKLGYFLPLSPCLYWVLILSCPIAAPIPLSHKSCLTSVTRKSRLRCIITIILSFTLLFFRSSDPLPAESLKVTQKVWLMFLVPLLILCRFLTKLAPKVRKVSWIHSWAWGILLWEHLTTGAMTLAVPVAQLATFNFPPSPWLPMMHPYPGASGPLWKFSWVDSLS